MEGRVLEIMDSRLDDSCPEEEFSSCELMLSQILMNLLQFRNTLVKMF